MRGARRFFSREKQVFLVGFSLTIPRFLRRSKNRLSTSLHKYMPRKFVMNTSQHSSFYFFLSKSIKKWRIFMFSGIRFPNCDPLYVIVSVPYLTVFLWSECKHWKFLKLYGVSRNKKKSFIIGGDSPLTSLYIFLRDVQDFLVYIFSFNISKIW